MTLLSRSCLALTAVLLTGSLIGISPCSADLVSWDGGSAFPFWGNDANWSNNSEPGISDRVFISNTPTGGTYVTWLDKGFSVQTLDISHGAKIETRGFDLFVAEDAIFTSFADLEIDSPPGTISTFSSENLTLRGIGATVNVDRLGIVEIRGGTFHLEDGALLSGSGLVTLDAGSGGSDPQFINDGFIESQALGIIAGDGSIDLDGKSENGIIEVIGIPLQPTLGFGVTGPLSDPEFNGRFLVNEATTVSISHAWILGVGGSLTFVPAGLDVGGTSFFSGSTFTQDGGSIFLRERSTVEFGVDMSSTAGHFVLEQQTTATLNRTAHFDNSEAIQIATGARLFLEESTTIDQAEFTGEGYVTYNGDIVVPADGLAILGVDLDWDGRNELTGGPSAAKDTTVGSGALLQIGGEINDDHDGIVLINGGTLDVTSTAWTTRNELRLENGGRVQGKRVVIEGNLRVVSNGTIEAPATLSSSASVFVDAAELLCFDGETTLAGGSYRGGGEIEQNGNLLVTAPTTIGTNFSLAGGALQFWLNTYDLDGADNDTQVQIGHGADLTINAEQLDSVAGNRFGGTITSLGGDLVVNTGERIPATGSPGTLPATVVPTGWQLAGTLNLLSLFGETPTITTSVGAPLEITGNVNALSGTANFALPLITFTSGNINVEGDAVLNLSLLEVNNGRFDVDGMLNFAETTFGAGTRVEIASGGTANLQGTTTFQGGQYSGLGALRQEGNAIVENDTTIRSALVFTGTSSTTIRESVVLAKGTNLVGDTASALILAGAEFSGKGLFHIEEESVVILQDGADVQVDFLNSGELTVGFGLGASLIGEAQFENFKNVGTLFFNLSGTDADDFDRLVVDSMATLAGTLSVDLIENSLPSGGDEFELLTAETVMGTFDELLLPSLSGITWELEYKPDSVVLRAVDALSVDTEPDGDVDGADFLALQRDNPSLIATWRTQYGISSGLLASAKQVPEPTALLLLASSLATLGTLRFT